jgi:hypothetical protein
MQIKTAMQLLKELVVISETAEDNNTRLFSIALATLISEIVPDDRTMRHIKAKAFSKGIN